MSCVSPFDGAVLLEVAVDGHALDFLVACFAKEVMDLLPRVRCCIRYEEGGGSYLTLFTIETTVHNRKPSDFVAVLETFGFGADFDDGSAPFVTLQHVISSCSFLVR